ncbi:hypothetical protein [Luteolibacter luteus]|uniref:Uncharacterized protein n=1 Tax=Luteolibacter luteus TaxID=2728835 RepID=A0A858RPD6_9BACT|nr:hypothetical protein [Luteolibacter luteus]QJE98722.1 hypothetical protein HHL09_24065 [Luteolibacter luteus]
MPPQAPQAQATARSPFAGCLILILALLMLVFLIGFSAWMPFRQAAEIEKFTQPSPTPLPVEAIEGNEPKVNALVERMETFRSGLEGDAAQPARLELSAEDLNLAIAAFQPVEQLRSSFRIREITKDALIIDICYKLNGRPRLAKDGEDGPVTSDPRYLIGTIKGHPELMRRELILKVDALEVPGATVPQGFLDHFSTLRIFEAHLKHPVLGPAMAAMTRVGLEDGKMVLSRIPGEAPPDVISEEQFRQGGSRIVKYLGIGACVFLAFAATMVFIGVRKQRRAEKLGQTSPDGDGA